MTDGRYLSGLGGNNGQVATIFPVAGDVTAISSPDVSPAVWLGRQDWVNDIRMVGTGWGYTDQGNRVRCVRADACEHARTWRRATEHDPLVGGVAAIAVQLCYTCRLIMHARGLGDDSPICVYEPRNEIMRTWKIEPGSTFIIKPVIASRDRSRSIYWGDTVVATDTGARRIGTRMPEIMTL